ncbi:MAG: hypothetical protein HYU64_16925 [Armatimonadetes bacterium]|nr:hypothetical protein [Armatimonadota bacterium]
MATSVQLSPFGQLANLPFARGLLQQLRAKADSPLQSAINFQNIALSRGLDVLTSKQRSAISATVQTDLQTQIKSSLVRNAVQVDDTLKTRIQQAFQGFTTARSRQEIFQLSQQETSGRVNGRKVFSNVERELRQVSTGMSNTSTNGTNASNQALTRNVQKAGNRTTVNTAVTATSQGALNIETLANRRTETQARVRTFDQAGQLTGDRTTRQAVTVDQQFSLAQTRQGESNRNIEQQTTVTGAREGNAAVREVRTATTDTAQGQTVIATATQNRTNTLVENLDQDGNVLSARRGSQLVAGDETRNIQTARQTQAEQVTRTVSRPNETDTLTQGRFETNATTVDQTRAAGTVQNFNGAGALVGERDFERNVTAVTVENRTGENQARTTVTRENGGTAVTTRVRAGEDVAVNTQITSDQGGPATVRTIDAQGSVRTTGEVENRVDADGNRTVVLGAEQVRQNQTRDLTVAPNGQGRLTETETRNIQAIQGQLQFNPATNQVGAAGAQAAPGAVVVDIGTNTGIRANFKMDNGVLTFDFTAQRVAATSQETTAGQVAAEGAPAGQGVANQRVVEENVRFQGRVVSSTDAEGNRVLSLEGTVAGEGAGAQAVNDGQGLQVERSRTEMAINGTLAVNRQTTVDGNQTTTNTRASAELNVNKVENREAAGVNVRTLTPLTANEGFRAGLSAYNGALRFNFGVFSMGISFVA